MSKLEDFIHHQKTGVELSKQNADNLYKSAGLLAENKYYSPAIPILILSAEEIIKSFALVLEVFLGSQSEVKKIIKGSKLNADNSYIFNHIDKHKLAIAIIADLKAYSPFINIFKPFLPNDFKEALNFMSISSINRTKIDSILIELNHLNSLKNEGLYVDDKGDIWNTPLKFSEKDYKKILENVNTLRSVFLPKIDYFINCPENDLVTLAEMIKKD